MGSIKIKRVNIRCKTCAYWRPQQAELGYNTDNGICVGPHLEFTIDNESDAKVLDRKNLSQVHMNVQRFENQSVEIPIGQVNPSRYCLVTASEFGCIHYKSK